VAHPRLTPRFRAGSVADSPNAQAGRLQGKEDTDPMDVKITVKINFSVSDSSLEDALAEYDEITVEGLIREIVDKAIACDDVTVKIEDGPNTLEEFDQLGN
jgi:hypothetical protein